MTVDLDIAGVAAELHCHVSTAQRLWRVWVEVDGFPQPFKGRGRGQRPWWTQAAVRAWKEARCGASGEVFNLVQNPQSEGQNRPANDPLPQNNFTDRGGLLAGLGG